MTFNGVVVPIRHVYASAQPGFFDRKVEDVRVLFSDRPLSDKTRDDTFGLMRAARTDEARIVEVVLDAKGEPISGTIYVPDGGTVSVSGMHVFGREAFERGRIAGRLSVNEPHSIGSFTWQYDASFSAPIPRAPTAAELKVALASPPAIAAGRYVTAVRAGDLNGFLSTMTATASADYRGRGGTALFQQLRAGMPRDSRVASLVPQTDGSVLVSVEGHAGGVVVAYELTMVLVGLDWKVGP